MSVVLSFATSHRRRHLTEKLLETMLIPNARTQAHARTHTHTHTDTHFSALCINKESSFDKDIYIYNVYENLPVQTKMAGILIVLAILLNEQFIHHMHKHAVFEYLAACL